jgi:hypothetical protein
MRSKALLVLHLLFEWVVVRLSRPISSAGRGNQPRPSSISSLLLRMFLTPASAKMLWMELTCRPRRGRDSQLLVPASAMAAKIKSRMTLAAQPLPRADWPPSSNGSLQMFLPSAITNAQIVPRHAIRP